MKTTASKTKSTATNTSAATKNAAAKTPGKRGPKASANGQSSKTKASADGQDNSDSQEKKESLFEKLFQDLLKDIYWAEKHLVEALPKMAEACTTDTLREAIEDHLHVTKKHVSRLEKVFKLLGKPAEAKKCDVMEGLVKEGNKVIEDTKEGTMTRDAGIIISAQKVEHYEIASYGSLVQVALTLGHDDVAYILEQTLREEEDTDMHLTDIAETEINPMADDEGDGNDSTTGQQEESSDGKEEDEQEPVEQPEEETADVY